LQNLVFRFGVAQQEDVARTSENLEISELEKRFFF